MARTMAPEPALFDPSELLAIFPQAPPALPFPSGRPALPDPGAKARADAPLTRDAFLAALANAPGLRAVTRLQISWEPFTRLALARGVVGFLSGPLIVPMILVFGSFGTVQLVVGLTGMLVSNFTSSILLPLFAGYRATLAFGHPGSAANRPAVRDYSGHGAAGLARWEQALLAVTANGDQDPSELLKHEPIDDRCTCAAPACAGGLRWRASLDRIVELVFKYCAFLVVAVCVLWSGVTAPGTWNHAWSITLAVISLMIQFVNAVGYSLPRFSTNSRLLEVTDRLRRRAMSLALRNMLAAYTNAVDCDDPSLLPAASPFPEPFEQLHHLFTVSWARRIRQYNTSSPLLFASGVHFVCAVANMAAGSCIPGLNLSFIGYVLFINLFDLLNVAAENRTISEFRATYLDAHRELRSLADRAARAAPLLRPAVSARAALLATFADLDIYRAKLLGFAVDYGVLRTLAVTLVTLIVGLWSILRGLGVFVTMQTICPAKEF